MAVLLSVGNFLPFIARSMRWIQEAFPVLLILSVYQLDNNSWRPPPTKVPIRSHL